MNAALVLFSPFNIYFQHSSFDLNFTLGWVSYAIQNYPLIPWHICKKAILKCCDWYKISKCCDMIGASHLAESVMPYKIIPWFHDIFARKQYWNAVIGTRYPNAVIWLVQDTYLKAAIWLLWDAYPYVAIWLVLNTYTYEAIWLMQDTSPNAANWLVQAKYHSTH